MTVADVQLASLIFSLLLDRRAVEKKRGEDVKKEKRGRKGQTASSSSRRA